MAVHRARAPAGVAAPRSPRQWPGARPGFAACRPGGVSSSRRTRSRCARSPSRISPARQAQAASSASGEIRRRAHRNPHDPPPRPPRLRSADCARAPSAPRAAGAAPPPRQFRLQRPADEHPFAHVVDRDPRDERAVLRLDDDKRSKASRLIAADTGKRDTPSRSQSADLVDRTARLQSPGQDRLLELAVDVVRLAGARSHMRPSLPCLTSSGLDARARRPFPADMLEARETRVVAVNRFGRACERDAR